MLDSLGERYGLLPSEVLDRANTLDLWVFDVAVSYRNYVNDREQAKHDPHKQTTQHIHDPQELKKRLEKFREDRGRQQ